MLMKPLTPQDVTEPASPEPKKRPPPKKEIKLLTPQDVPEPVRKMGGGMTKAYAGGGPVRGAGIAKRGVKNCRMV